MCYKRINLSHSSIVHVELFFQCYIIIFSNYDKYQRRDGSIMFIERSVNAGKKKRVMCITSIWWDKGRSNSKKVRTSVFEIKRG
mgnify:CR=1 FL=1